jgi:hypothetical protein
MSAIFSDCRQYRYTLMRRWDGFGNGVAMFIGLNPSTADETVDDPTIRRCINFAKLWGCSELCMTNLFAFRATDPSVMKAQQWPQSEPSMLERNDLFLLQKAKESKVVVAAWGTHGAHLSRAFFVTSAFWDAGIALQCLGRNKDGSPKHPLYLAANSQLTEYQPANEPA